MVEKTRLRNAITYSVLSVLAVFCLTPFALMVMSSLSSEASLIQFGYNFFPREFSLNAYDFILNQSPAIIRGYGITILITSIGTLINLTLTVLIAYPLSRRDLPKRNLFSFMIFFTMLFNGGLVPSYIMWTQLFGIKNTLFALLIPNLMLNAFYVIMMRTYFSTNIPTEIIEAAKIDGAHEVRVLTQVVLPMSLPILATVGLMVGLIYWNDWTNGLYYLNDPKLFSIQNILNRMLLDARFLATHGASLGTVTGELGNLPDASLRMAVAAIGAVPILIIYPFFQKYFVKGITVGAVKG